MTRAIATFCRWLAERLENLAWRIESGWRAETMARYFADTRDEGGR